jgi:rubrerythrin
MAKSIKGTQTEKNLLAAFAGESPAECPACSHPRAYYEVMAENY